MSLYEDTNPRSLKNLLVEIHDGESVLPDFQRDFVWDPTATQELIVSIANNYPAGSLLRIRNTHNLFPYRQFQGAPEPSRHPTYLVLDGQQRLSSLYQAFYGVGEHRYYLDLGRLLASDDFEDAIFHLRATDRRVAEYAQPEVQARRLTLPLLVLANGYGAYVDWLDDAHDTVPEVVDETTRKGLKGLGKHWIQTVAQYLFPVVTLCDTASASAVCTIFETLNRTGVKLGPFELLTARYWPEGVRLRDLWERARDRCPIIGEFKVDPYYVLQTIALLARDTPSCKRRDVMDLSAQSVANAWDGAAQGLGTALEILRNECGVLTPDWLPYYTILVPMAAILTQVSRLKGPTAGGARDKVKNWFWCAVFGQKYESSPNSQSAADFQQMTTWINGGPWAETVCQSGLDFDSLNLRDTTVRQRAVYRGTIALVMRKQPLDFHSGRPLTPSLIASSKVDDHHVFPADFLEPSVADERLRDCVLNHTLIDAETNRRIGARPPSKYMLEIQEERGAEKLDELLRSHLLPTGDSSPFWSDNYEAFLKWREETLWQQIREVTSVAETQAENG